MSVPDLAPSLPSRIVKGRSTEITERGPIKGGTVTISLSKAILSVPDKTYLEASSVTVPLDASADGTWEVRLPTVSANVEPRDSWTITVKYSTRPYPFQIRVPAGTGPIDIADIGEVHGVAPEHAGWVVTGMQVGTVTTGPAAARISGQAPTLTLDLTIPKGEKGDPGAGIAVLGTKATTTELPTGAKIGDAWLVGTNLHVWNGSAWTNTGPLRGPTGATGATPQLSAKAVTLSPTQAATASVAGPAGTPELTIGVPKGRDGASITKVEQTGGQSADVIITDPNTGQTTRTTILLPAGTATFDEVQEDIWEAGSGGDGLVTTEQLLSALAGKVDGTDSRLSNARTPTAHTHPVTDVTGLAARLDALEYRSGVRNIAGLLVNASGTVTVERTGPMVTLSLEAVSPTSSLTSGATLITIPSGFRPTKRYDIHLISTGTSTNRSAFIFTSGAIGVWTPAATDRYRLVMTYPTSDPTPTALPGTPA